MFKERLKLARRRSGLSLRRLSSAMEGVVSAQAIGKYERGAMMPSSTVTIALAEALDVPVSYLLSPTHVSLQSVEFRKQTSASVRERASVEANVLDHVDRYLQIEEILGIDTARHEVPGKAPYRITSVESAEDAAHWLRTAWNLGGGPIPDISEMLEERGVKVFRLDLPGTVDGLSCRVRRANGDDVPAVVYSTGTSPERERFTIAHELGHMVMDIPSSVNKERACQRFAGAFLAPGHELVRELGRHRHNFGFAELIEIKHMFGISAAALVMRMRDLRIISDATVTGIFAGIGCTWKTDEPAPMERGEDHARFRRLCLRALAESEISQSKAAELLRLKVSEIETIMAGSSA